MTKWAGRGVSEASWVPREDLRRIAVPVGATLTILAVDVASAAFAAINQETVGADRTLEIGVFAALSISQKTES